MGMCFRTFHFDGVVGVPSYVAWLMNCDMRETYTIVDRVGIRVLRDPYSSKPYVEFYTTKRVGGDVLNFDAMKFIKFGS